MFSIQFTHLKLVYFFRVKTPTPKMDYYCFFLYDHLTSVTASRDAECFSSRSIDRMWFFLQAIWRGVKPFWGHSRKELITRSGAFRCSAICNEFYWWKETKEDQTRARALALAPLSSKTLAMRWWPQWAATWSGVKWSRVMSSISALYCSSCRTQSMWSPWAAMWIGDRPFCWRIKSKNKTRTIGSKK